MYLIQDRLKDQNCPSSFKYIGPLPDSLKLPQAFPYSLRSPSTVLNLG